MTGLPIDAVLPELLRALASRTRLVLQAPPGAGKTTRIPPALTGADWLGDRRILMLEPRRLAARAAASFMARQLGQDVGETVGYRVRLDTRVSAATRIVVVTEGVLTRMIQDDPALDEAGIVIFDEFHERSIHADLGLALALQSQSLLRPDLRILAMSATLDVSAITTILDDAAVVRCEGRAHPVDTVFLDRPADGPVEALAAATAHQALDRHDGDILVFLPGAAEIRRTAARLADADLPGNTLVVPLFGDLPRHEQDRAIAPAPHGHRKVVLATAIAETSLTIDGVRVVVDSGLMRVPRFSPRSGMTRLVTIPVSRDSADQRRGRAGRSGPGTCYRLWTRHDDAGLVPHRTPEILETDLATLALELAAWGSPDPAGLRWIDPPPPAAFAHARELLRALDAVDSAGRITPHGRHMARLAMHPRLAHMLLRARSLEPAGSTPHPGQPPHRGNGAVAHLACDLVSLLADRDILRAEAGLDGAGGVGGRAAGADPDVRLRLPLVRGRGTAPPGHVLDRAGQRRVMAEAEHWRRRLRLGRAPSDARSDEWAGVLLAYAYPDRIGQRRGEGRGRYVLRNGKGATIEARHNLAGSEFIVAAELGGRGRDEHVFLGAPLERADIERHFADRVELVRLVAWDEAARTVRAREQRRVGALVLGERPTTATATEVRDALTGAVRSAGPDLLEWGDADRRLRARLAFLHAHAPDAWPDVSDAALLERLEEWLTPWLDGPDALRRLRPGEALLGLVGWERRSRLDELAPTHVQVPSGSRIAVDYTDPSAPVLAVRLQEMFGLEATPHVGGGRVPLTLHLLSPAGRPVQVTRDLASFWRGAYFDVRRDLRGRYPKHYWPDDPLEAEPTRRTRPR